MKPKKLKRALLKLELRTLERESANASKTLKAIQARQAKLGKLLVWVLAGEFDVPAINAVCREMRATVSEEDQANARLFDTLRARVALENQLWPARP